LASSEYEGKLVFLVVFFNHILFIGTKS
jgi:hypothetical protein